MKCWKSILLQIKKKSGNTSVKVLSHSAEKIKEIQISHFCVVNGELHHLLASSCVREKEATYGLLNVPDFGVHHHFRFYPCEAGGGKFTDSGVIVSKI